MKLLMENWKKYLAEMGVGAFTGGNLQLFIPRACPDEECSVQEFKVIRPVKNGNSTTNKPWGGVWTSTAILANPGTLEEIWTSGWNEWMKSEMPSWMNPEGFLLKPTTSEIFHIENEEDLERLATEFPLKGEASSSPFGFGRSSSPIDYEKAFEVHAAIHFGTKSGQSAHPDPGMWDAESTCWKDLSVLDDLGVVSIDFDKPSWD